MPPLTAGGDRRLLIVSGKGGVGKSTVSAALAVASADVGRQTLVVELAGRSDVAWLLGGQPRPALVEAELLPNLFHVTIDRQAALRYYLDREVPGPLPVGRLVRSRVFSAFVEATPGMGELLSIGKVSELTRVRRRPRGTRSYDQVVLDGPASGQLMALLSAPSTFRAIARVGPVARQTADIDRLLTDSGATGVIAVTTPEQMAVSEVLQLRGDLASAHVPLEALVVNQIVSSPFTAADERRFGDAADDPALRSARWLCDRARAQRREIGRLRRGAPVTTVRLPLLMGGVRRIGVEQLAARLSQAMP